ncbi:hypothetical protein Moror_15890 [Moniliophthora roreri MCA 2997]|uniref:Uncharacterized protein n=1 Tax=Moniliophthora roreri (strain MCA 2997) TaxID=1381753 RepID=V2X107_MONRO|nr:hypothetical protein Moror_15890 [Moniliophthora roreri MCA 2997]
MPSSCSGPLRIPRGCQDPRALPFTLHVCDYGHKRSVFLTITIASNTGNSGRKAEKEGEAWWYRAAGNLDPSPSLSPPTPPVVAVETLENPPLHVPALPLLRSTGPTPANGPEATRRTFLGVIWVSEHESNVSKARRRRLSIELDANNTSFSYPRFRTQAAAAAPKYAGLFNPACLGSLSSNPASA